MSMLGKSPGFSLFQVPSSPLPPPLPHSPALLNACAAPLPPRLLPPPRLTHLPCSARARLSRPASFPLFTGDDGAHTLRQTPLAVRQVEWAEQVALS